VIERCCGRLVPTGETSSLDSSPGLSDTGRIASIELERLVCASCKQTTLASKAAGVGACMRKVER
jgi:hypothetical protein